MEQATLIKQGSNYIVQHGTDAGLYVEFYMEALEDEEQSKVHGRPIYRDVEFIKIVPVGDKNTIVCRPVRFKPEGNIPADSDRWPKKYQDFKNQQVQVEEGTPVTEWPPLSKSQALMLKGMNIHTVEALASVGDNNLHNIGMGARDLRDKAKAFIEQSEKGSGLLRLQSENEDLKLQIQAMKAQMEEFGKLMASHRKTPEIFSSALPDDLEEETSISVEFLPPKEPEQIDFTPATSSYGKRGRPPKQQQIGDK